MISIQKHKKAASLRRLWNALKLYGSNYEHGEKQSGLRYLQDAVF